MILSVFGMKVETFLVQVQDSLYFIYSAIPYCWSVFNQILQVQILTGLNTPELLPNFL